MKNSDNNHQEFEKSWKDAFEGAEMMPSEDVWVKIDGALANQDSRIFKRKITFYKYAAAISLLMLLGGGLFTYLYVNENMTFKSEMSDAEELPNQQKIVKENNEAKDFRIGSENPGITGSGNSSIESKELASGESSDKSIASGEIADPNVGKELISPEIVNKRIAGNSTSPSDDLKESGTNRQINPPVIEDHKHKTIVLSQPNQEIADFHEPKPLNSGELDTPELTFENELTEGRSFENIAFAPYKGFDKLIISNEKAQKEVYRVPDYRLAYSRKKDDNKEFYAGLSFTPNFFDPNIQMNSGNAQMSSGKIQPATLSTIGVNPKNNEQNEQPQMSYAYGLSFGLKLSKKWIIHSGLQYAKNNTVSSTQSFLQPDFNNAVRYAATPVTLNKLSNEGLISDPDQLGFTQPVPHMVELNNNFEFASIPVKAGYIIVDKKLSWVISTGVGTDLFLNNQIQDQHHQYEKVTIRPGDSSPYRQIYFSGLASSEIIYNFARNYSFSLEPSYRIALNSFSKSGSLITSLPQSFGVAAGFRYHFRK